MAAPAAPGGLARRRDPERSTLAAARKHERFGIGRAEGLVRDMSNAGLAGVCVQRHQNNDFAAVPAAAISGPGTKPRSSTRTPLTPSTSFNSTGIGSNGAAGS